MPNQPSHAASVPFDGRKVVTTHGTAVPLTTTKTPSWSVDITAETDNTGSITVGASTVVDAVGTTRRGTPLAAGDTKTFDFVDLSQVYIDSAVDGDGVTYSGVTSA
jgi:hypothetical protein